MPDILVLGSGQKTPHHHVMLHTLAQWSDWGGGGNGSHGKFLSIEGTRTLSHRARPAQSLTLSRYLTPRDSPAKAGSSLSAFTEGCTSLEESASLAYIPTKF
jgi:hypothetical protein